MIIPFKEYMPDQADLGAATTALNCAPTERGYTQLKGLSTYSDALTGRCHGFYSVKDSTANVYNVAGDATKLYLMQSASFSDASKTGGYSLSDDDRWEFGIYGDKIIAVNGISDTQYITAGDVKFGDLDGNPPIAHSIGVVGTHVLLGNVYDSIDGEVPHRVWWCATNNPEDWTPSVATQCDYRTLEGEGGKIQRVIGGEWATIFQENAIVRLTYVGAPLVFQADEIENRGTDAPGSVVKLGRFIFYKSHDGFYMFNGEYSEPIGVGKIDKTILADIDNDYLYRITAQIDINKRLVKWAYPGAGNTNGRPNKMIIYHWPSKKWATANLEIEQFADFLGEGYTLEELDAFGDLDSLTDSLDSDVWKGGYSINGAFNTSHQLAQFTGSALAAQMETEEMQLVTNKKAMVRDVRPIIDAGTPVITIKTRNNQTDSKSESSALTAAPSGKYATRSTARYHTFKITTSTTFEDAIGVDVTAKERGSR